MQVHWSELNCMTCNQLLVVANSSQRPSVDVCRDAHGIWFDKEEIDMFLESPPPVSPDLGPAQTSSLQEIVFECPRCRPVQEVVLCRLGSSQVLKCSYCAGMWLPYGALTSLQLFYPDSCPVKEVNEASLYARAHEFANEESAPKQFERYLPLPSSHLLWSRSIFWIFVALVAIGFLTEGLVASKGTLHYTSHSGRGPGALIMGIVAGLVFFARGFRLDRVRAIFGRVTFSRTATVHPGLVKVCGSVRPHGDVLKSPLSGTPCVYWRCTIESSGFAWDGQRDILGSQSSEQPFFIDDETGQMEVIPLRAETFIRGGVVFKSSIFRSFPPKVCTGLEQIGLDSHLSSINGRVCTESLLMPGDIACVLGTAKPYPARTDSVTEGYDYYTGSSSDHPFLISDSSDKDLNDRLAWKAAGMLYGGPVLSFVCALLLLLYFN